MQTPTKLVIGTFLIGLPAFALLSPHGPPGNMMWSPAPGPEAVGIQVGLLIFYSLLSALAMGFGLSFLAFGRHWTRRTFPVLSLPAHLAIGFIIASFWIHDNLHAVNGDRVAGLIAIEYLFHLPLMLSGLMIIVASAKSATTRRPAPRAAAAPS